MGIPSTLIVLTATPPPATSPHDCYILLHVVLVIDCTWKGGKGDLLGQYPNVLELEVRYSFNSLSPLSMCQQLFYYIEFVFCWRRTLLQVLQSLTNRLGVNVNGLIWVSFSLYGVLLICIRQPPPQVACSVTTQLGVFGVFRWNQNFCEILGLAASRTPTAWRTHLPSYGQNGLLCVI